jgi:photosystem II stability/assembly factor-like uncharacterized protein
MGYVACAVASSVVTAGLLLWSGTVFAGAPNKLTVAPNLAKFNLSISDKPAPNIACSADGKTVYVVTRAGIFKSEDGGENWLRIVDDQ